jgi:hypothetical protein
VFRGQGTPNLKHYARISIMSNSPWSAYGRLPLNAEKTDSMQKTSPVANVVSEAIRGREQLEKYLQGVMAEYSAIQSGNAGYRRIVSDVLAPSDRPETIEERLNRLAAEAQARRPQSASRSPRKRSR